MKLISSHNEHVGAAAGLVNEEVRGPLHELFLGSCAVAERLDLLFDPGDIARALRFNQHVGDRVAGIRDVLDGSLVGRVQGREPVQAGSRAPGQSPR